MKKLKVILSALMLMSVCVGAGASEAPKPGDTSKLESLPLASKSEKKKLLKESLFEVSTDDFDASDSLNRVAGEIDMGFTSRDSSYRSKNHQAASPFAREKAEMDAQPY